VNGNVKVLQNPVGSSLQFSYNASSNEKFAVNFSGRGQVYLQSSAISKRKQHLMLSLDSKMTKGFYLFEIADGITKAYPNH
jgi:uncharacterized protein (AIM24 family)